MCLPCTAPCLATLVPTPSHSSLQTSLRSFGLPTRVQVLLTLVAHLQHTLITIIMFHFTKGAMPWLLLAVSRFGKLQWVVVVEMLDVYYSGYPRAPVCCANVYILHRNILTMRACSQRRLRMWILG